MKLKNKIKKNWPRAVVLILLFTLLITVAGYQYFRPRKLASDFTKSYEAYDSSETLFSEAVLNSIYSGNPVNVQYNKELLQIAVETSNAGRVSLAKNALSISQFWLRYLTLTGDIEKTARDNLTTLNLNAAMLGSAFSGKALEIADDSEKETDTIRSLKLALRSRFTETSDFLTLMINNNGSFFNPPGAKNLSDEITRLSNTYDQLKEKRQKDFAQFKGLTGMK